ncbi:MAG TPA: ABC transporter permease [Fulvivirga sp.]|nr:ABC transporter permease [Fulvivirga sp.]
MLKNILKISVRNLLKEKFYTCINLLGLAVGVGACLLIAQYIVFETSFDKHHPDANEIYRVNQTNFWSPDGGIMGSTVLPLAEALKSEFPEVESTLRINTVYDQLITVEGTSKSYQEEDVLGADSTFFDFFGFKLAEGDPNTALDKINSVVISDKMAKKYFGEEPALGKTLLLGNDKQPITVTGVLQKEQPNTHFDFNILLSIYTNPNVKQFEWSWIWTQAVTYVKIKGSTKNIEDHLSGLADKYAKGAFSRLGIDLADFEKEKGELTFYLQPVTDIHLHSRDIHNRLGTDGDIFYVYVFSIVGVMILFLACINFVNLTTARAAVRAKEVGVKKVLGSTRSLLIGQILVETFMLSIIATGLGLGLAELMRLAILTMLNIDFSINVFANPLFATGIFLMPLFIGLIAGLYPAFSITSFKPINVLKGQMNTGKEASFFRNALVVIQFTIAIGLMAATFIISDQLSFFQNGNMGFNRDNILIIDQADKLGSAMMPFYEKASQHPAVKQLAITSVVPGMGSPEDVFFAPSNPDRKLSLGTIKVDNGYLTSLGIGLLQGRNFEKNKPEANNVMINEMAMRDFGWTEENVIGQKISYFNDEFTVIGLVKDFHSLPFYYPIAPVILLDLNAPIWNDSRQLLLTIDMSKKQELVNYLNTNWAAMNNTNPFNYSYLDDQLGQLYESENKLSKLFTVFTGLAILIAIIGLLGLASFVTSNKTKEIGIRKVLGASVGQLILKVNFRFSVLILISCLLAVPLTLWAMTNWLQQFQYRITIGWEVFALTILLAIGLAWLTVSYHSIKAARANPVDSLKDE